MNCVKTTPFRSNGIFDSAIVELILQSKIAMTYRLCIVTL